MIRKTFASASRTARAFTLIELLVVIGIIGLLLAILLPTLSKGRASAQSLACVSNLRQMQIAQAFYANDENGWLVQAGLGHPDHDDDHGHEGEDEDDREHAELDELGSWLVLLSKYAEEGLVSRCGEDQSPHWPEGTPAFVHEDGEPVYRRTSYGINNYLSVTAAPEGHEDRWGKLSRVKNSSGVVQFLEMAYVGPFAASDHPHLHELDTTDEPPHVHAGEMLQLSAHGFVQDPAAEGVVAGPTSRANYGFLDGHAETRVFEQVYRTAMDNAFNPELHE